MALWHFVTTVLDALIGVSGFLAFIIFKNYPAAILAIATGVINIVASHINFLHHKNKLEEWYSPQHLRQISCFGFYSFAFSTSALVYFSVIEIMEEKTILPIQDSAVIPIIWAFITLKSGLFLLYLARSYSNENHTLLVEESNYEETNDQIEYVIEP